MAYEIRPLSFSEILERALRVYLDNFVLLVGISAIAFIPDGVLNAMAPVLGISAAVLGFLYLSIGVPVMHAAMIIAVASVYLDRPTTIADAYRETRPIIGAIVWTYLLLYLLLTLAAIALIIPAIYFGVCWALVGPVMVLERRFGMQALSRSRDLIRGWWWWTLGITLMATLIAEIPATALEFYWSSDPVLGPILTAAVRSVAYAYGMVAVVIYYFDRRCRAEDFDLHLLASQIRSETAASPARTPGSAFSAP